MVNAATSIVLAAWACIGASDGLGTSSSPGTSACLAAESPGLSATEDRPGPEEGGATSSGTTEPGTTEPGITPSGDRFLAGAAAIDITPRSLPVIVSGGFLEARADRIEDPLHARALVLDDGTTRIAIAVVDTLMMPRRLIDEVRELASSATGIPADNMIVAATHTHSAPSVMGALGTGVDEEYARFLPGRVALAIEEAAKVRVPARIAWAALPVPEYTHTRRWILRPDKVQLDPFGERTVRAMMHPGYRNPEYIGPSGPTDVGLTVLSVRTIDGRPLALLANYSQHYVGAPPVSADYFGVFARRVGELLGSTGGEPPFGEPPFVGILSQGTAGDQHWMDYAEAPRADLDRFTIADGLARAAVRAVEGVEHRSWVRLGSKSATLHLSRRLPGAEREAWARGVLAGMQGRAPASIPEVYAREQVLLLENPSCEARIQAVMIGDLGISAIPAEVFGITGLEIKERSPFGTTCIMELAGGAEGYIPPPAQHVLGGYTTWPARSAGLEPDAEPRIVEAALALLEGLRGEPRREDGETLALRTKSIPWVATVLASKPVAYWRLGEFRGPAAKDATGNGHAARCEGAMAFRLEGPPLPGLPSGLGNPAIHLAGGRIEAELPIHGEDYSVGLWAFNGLPCDLRDLTGVILSIAREGGGGADETTLAIGGKAQGGSAGCLILSCARPESGGTVTTAAGTTKIEPKSWHRVYLLASRRRVEVCLDGRREISLDLPEMAHPGAGNADPATPATPATPRERALRIILGAAATGSGDSSFEGRLDEAAVWEGRVEEGCPPN